MTYDKINTDKAYIIAFEYSDKREPLAFFTESDGWPTQTTLPNYALRMNKITAVLKAEELATKSTAKVVVLATQDSVVYEVTKDDVEEKSAARKNKEKQEKIEKLIAELAALEAELNK